MYLLLKNVIHYILISFTDTNQYWNFKSCHPYHMKRSVAKRICTTFYYILNSEILSNRPASLRASDSHQTSNNCQIHQLKRYTGKEFKVTKYGKANCSLCQHIVEAKSYDFNGKIFHVNQNMTCDVQNVIFVLTCNGWAEYYIGQTVGKLRTRPTIHVQQIRDPSTRMIGIE